MQLEAMTDAHFAWLLGEGEAPASAPRVAEGGLASAEIIALLRGVAAELGGEANCTAQRRNRLDRRDLARQWSLSEGASA